MAQALPVLNYIAKQPGINEAIGSWTKSLENTGGNKQILVCNDTKKRWRLWIGDSKYNSINWLDPGCTYYHTFQAYHSVFLNTHHWACLYSKDDDTYAAFSIYGEGVPTANNLFIVTNDAVLFMEGPNKMRPITVIKKNASKSDYFKEVVLMRKENVWS